MRQLESLKSEDRCYKIKVINNGKGVANVSAVNGHPYNLNNRKEPKGKIFGPYKSKFYKRGTILRKFRIWENGQNLVQQKKQKLLDLQ